MINLRKTLTSIVMSACLVAPNAWAVEHDCSGVNLMEQMRVEDPAAAKIVDDAAAVLPFTKGLLWQVTKDGVKPSYIYGTIHMSDPRLVDLPPKAQKAFDQATTLTLEITEILDPSKMAGKAFSLLKYTTYLDGQTLDEKMEPTQIDIVKERVETAGGLPWSIAKKLKPWTIMGSISLPACEAARKKAGKPFLDMALGLKAKEQGKEITALETVEGQMATMDSLPEAMMIKSLVETAKLAPKLNDMFETMIQLYLKGETGTIWAMMRQIGSDGATQEDASAYAEFQRVVVDKRNFSMAEKSALLIDKGGAFIAVGALHLPGEKGLLNILAQKGYAIHAH